MDDKKFDKMDQGWMDKMKSLRDKEVPEGLMKGFSTSVERRITAGKEAPAKKSFVFGPVFVPALAVMVLASVAVLRMPGVSTLPGAPSQVQLAQVVSDVDVQEEIDVLKELGVWDEMEDTAVLGEEELLAADELELTSSNSLVYGLA